MADKILLGKGGVIMQGVERSFSHRSGWSNTLTWRGEKKFGPGKEQELIAAGYETLFREEGPNCTIIGTRSGIESGGVEVPVDRWERRINRLEKSIYENAKLVSELGNVLNVTYLRQQVEDKEFRAEDYNNGKETVANAWFSLIMAGVDSFVVFQPVVTYVRTVSNRFDKATLAKVNVGKILTAAQMTAEGAPAFVLDDENETYPSGVFFATRFGYFKNNPQFVPTAENKWEITTEYELGRWASKIYSAAT